MRNSWTNTISKRERFILYRLCRIAFGRWLLIGLRHLRPSAKRWLTSRTNSKKWDSTTTINMAPKQRTVIATIRHQLVTNRIKCRIIMCQASLILHRLMHLIFLPKRVTQGGKKMRKSWGNMSQGKSKDMRWRISYGSRQRWISDRQTMMQIATSWRSGFLINTNSKTQSRTKSSRTRKFRPKFTQEIKESEAKNTAISTTKCRWIW